MAGCIIDTTMAVLKVLKTAGGGKSTQKVLAVGAEKNIQGSAAVSWEAGYQYRTVHDGHC